MKQAITWRNLMWWTVFAVAFGYVEALVVIYIRKATGMATGLDYPAIFAARGLPFDSASITAEMRRQGVLSLELSREASTLILLFGAVWAGGSALREKWGLFCYTFAVWDLSYYLYLAFWIGFPRALGDIDIYFLIPLAWYGPVWLPVLVCMPALIVLSLWQLRLLPNRCSERAGEVLESEA